MQRMWIATLLLVWLPVKVVLLDQIEYAAVLPAVYLGAWRFEAAGAYTSPVPVRRTLILCVPPLLLLLFFGWAGLHEPSSGLITAFEGLCLFCAFALVARLGPLDRRGARAYLGVELGLMLLFAALARLAAGTSWLVWMALLAGSILAVVLFARALRESVARVRGSAEIPHTLATQLPPGGA